MKISALLIFFLVLSNASYADFTEIVAPLQFQLEAGCKPPKRGPPGPVGPTGASGATGPT
ncbi:hypothetical protein DB43_DM00010, partial [Parachlamydia acanthamoebae]